MRLQLVKPTHSRVVIAGLVDAALVIGASLLIFNHLSFDSEIYWNILPKIYEYPNMSIVICFVLYRFISIVLFGSTLGMKLVGLTFLNEEEERPNLVEKILASVFILFQGVNYYWKNKYK